MKTEEHHQQFGSDKAAMVLNISLDHLKEEEVQLIMEVLERDAKIQQTEEVRKMRLNQSIRGERIPEKRLSVKIRTGEWMDEMKEPSRAMKRRGTDVVRASIRRKVSTKQTRDIEKTEQEELTGTQKKAEVIENEGAPSIQDNFAQNAANTDDIKTSAGIPPYRKTSMRRKKQHHDKQVKFNTEKTEEFVYEQTSIDSSEGIEPIASEKTIPSIVIQPEEGITQEFVDVAQPVEVTVITDDDVPMTAAKEEQPDDNAPIASNMSFESYHNAVGKEMYKEEGDKKHQDGDRNESEKSGEEAPKVPKKIKVIKRKGSSRRKAGQITDDSSRDTIFDAPNEKTQDVGSGEKELDDAVETAVTDAGERKVKVIKRKGSSRRRVGKITDDTSRDTLFGSADSKTQGKNKEGKVVEETTRDIIAAAVDEIKKTHFDSAVQKIPDEIGESEVGRNLIETMSDDVYPQAEMKEVAVHEDLSAITEGIAKEYKKLVETDEHMKDGNELKNVGNEEAVSQPESYNIALDDTENNGEADVANDDERKGGEHFLDSLKSDLDSGLSDVLAAITEKYDSMSAEIKETLTDTGNETSPRNSEHDSQNAGHSHREMNVPELQPSEPHSDDMEIRKALVGIAKESQSFADNGKLQEEHNTGADVQSEQVQLEASASKNNAVAERKEAVPVAPTSTEKDLDFQEQVPDQEVVTKAADASEREDRDPVDLNEASDILSEVADDPKQKLHEASHITPTESERGAEENRSSEEHRLDEPKKKAVKKVIKKKKTEKPTEVQAEPQESEISSKGDDNARVKRVIKKKKPEKTDEPQPESPKQEKGNEENDDASVNLSQLSRKKTVRKKVVRRAPPPSE